MSETLYPDDSAASQGFKLVRLGRELRAQWIKNPGAEINIFGYISADAAYDSTKEQDERASMRQRINSARDTLNQIGVPAQKVWAGGVAYASNRAGQIDLFIRDGQSTFVLPPYPPYVSTSEPKNASDAREHWLDSDAEIGVDPKEREVEVEVGVKYEGASIPHMIRPNLKFVFRSDGTLKEVGTELELLKRQIAKKIAGFEKVEVSVKTVGSLEFDKTAAERHGAQLQAKLKLELEAKKGYLGNENEHAGQAFGRC